MQTDTENIRPESYWSHNDPLAQILAGVSGKARRAMIKDFWEAGNLEQMEDALLNDELEPEQRTRLGQIHPFFMGGEYLPQRLAGEVTIARIDLESTTYDVIELRARPLHDGRIKLRWVDEYDSEFSHKPYPDVIDQPFSFKEIKDFIRSTRPHPDLEAPLPLAYNVGNLTWGTSGEAENLRCFTRFSSEFYPELASWAKEAVNAWIQEIYDQEAAEDDD